MTTGPAGRPLAPYLFRRGSKLDSPILLPLAKTCGDMRAMKRFCRSICPGSPVLVPDMGRIKEENTLVDRVAEVIVSAVRVHGLSLIPIVVVGHAEGANLAAKLALAHGSLLAACILLQPTAGLRMLCPKALDGIHVLLTRPGSEEAAGTAGWQLHKALTESGAEVICERVLRHRLPGSREAAIARVFIAALFRV